MRDAAIAASGAQAAKLWKMRESLAEAQLSAGGSIAARCFRAGVAHPGVPGQDRRRADGGLSRHPPLRLRPCRRRQHALQPGASD